MKRFVLKVSFVVALHLMAPAALFGAWCNLEPNSSCSVAYRGDRLSIAVRDCPIGELLAAVAKEGHFYFYFDPYLTDRITVSIDNEGTEYALARVLKSFDYKIAWDAETEPGGRRIARLSGVWIYRTGHAEESGRIRTTEVDSRAERAGSVRGTAAGLLRDYLGATNEAVRLSSRFALSRIADASVVRMIAAAYEDSGDWDIKERIESLIESISSPEAERELIGLAGPPGRISENPLHGAVLRALGNMGTATATDHLLERIEKGRGEELDELTEIVRNVVETPFSVSALRFAALGNKRFASEPTRVAAIRGLARFDDDQTRAAMHTLARDSNAAICLAARKSLQGGLPGEDIEP